jgi:hypothetical protein
VVSFSYPCRSQALSVYNVDVNRCTDEIRSVGDFRKSRVFGLGE